MENNMNHDVKEDGTNEPKAESENASKQTLTFPIKGMHCHSCEHFIETKLREIDGVSRVKADRRKGGVVLECLRDVSLDEVNSKISDHGYSAHLDSDSSSHHRRINYKEIGASLMIIIGIYFILTQFNILPENFGIKSNMSYWFVFVLGLIAATSTCIAVTGGILLSLSAKYSSTHPHLKGMKKFTPHLYFNLGRIISYSLFGGIIGFFGSFIAVSSTFSGVIIIIASILMIIVGLQLLKIFPFLNKIQVKAPKFIANKIYSAEAGAAPSKVSSALLGGATFFLPCGFTQALQLYVLGTGSFIAGALNMFAFSLGTMPSLLSIGLLTSFAKGKYQRYITTFSAVLVIFIGLLNVPNGFALTGINVNDLSIFGGDDEVIKSLDQNVEIINGKQIARMTVDGLDYYPSNFRVVKGVPVRWEIDGSNAVGCALAVLSPKLGIAEYLPRDGIKVIEFTPKTTGIFPFHCSMGMTTPGSAFEVVEA